MPAATPDSDTILKNPMSPVRATCVPPHSSVETSPIASTRDMQMAELDPSTMTWTALSSSGKSDWNAEEGWTLMPNGTLLTVDVLNNPNSEHYVPSQQVWVSD